MAVLVALVAVLLLPVSAQSRPRLNINNVNTTDFPSLELLVSVENEVGAAGEDFEVTDFAVTVNDKPVTVTDVSQVIEENLPISVILVIDTSESMSGAPLENTLASVRVFQESLRPVDEVALVGFNSQPELLLDFTTDREALLLALEEVQVQGRTALYDAVAFAAETATRASHPRRFILFLTDGQEFGDLSTNLPEAGITIAEQNGTTFFTIGIGYVDETYLQTVAQRTNGTYFNYANSLNMLSERYREISDYLRRQYVLVLAPADLEPDGSRVAVSVSADFDDAMATFTAPDLFPSVVFEALPSGPLNEVTTLAYQVEAVRGLQRVTVEFLDNTSTPLADAGGLTEFDDVVTVDPYTFTGETEVVVTAQDVEGGVRSLSIPITAALLPPQIELTGLDTPLEVAVPVTAEVNLVRGQRPIQQVMAQLNGEQLAVSTAYGFELDPLVLSLSVPAELTVTVADGEAQTTISRRIELNPATVAWQPRLQENDGVMMALVPPGCFEMGSLQASDEQPVHTVCIDSAFWIDVLPVTNVSYGSVGLFTGDDRPRERLSWQLAREHCAARGARLPTEAEWAFAMRGPESLSYPWGDEFIVNYVVHAANSNGITQPVGTRPGSASWVGAEDGLGNVWQWTSSLYRPYPYDSNDGREAPIGDGLRVLRGGAATNVEPDIYIANRLALQPVTGYGVTGVRCVVGYNS